VSHSFQKIIQTHPTTGDEAASLSNYFRVVMKLGQ